MPDRFELARPIEREHSAPNIAVKRRVRPVLNALHHAMLDLINIDVVEEQVSTPIEQIEREEPASAGNEGTCIERTFSTVSAFKDSSLTGSLNHSTHFEIGSRTLLIAVLRSRSLKGLRR
jgi:hypothetical protein